MKRRICRKITKNRLDEYLALVGCGTRFCGARTWRIVNAYGDTTVFQFRWDPEEDGDEPLYDLRLDGWGENKPFGKGPESYLDGGFGSFLLKNCRLEAVSDDGVKYDFVSISAGNEKKDRNKEGYAYIAFSPVFESAWPKKEEASRSQKKS